MYTYLTVLPAVNVKTGEIFPATFPEKGPDMPLRNARHFTGGHQVGSVSLKLSFYPSPPTCAFAMMDCFVIVGDPGYLRCKLGADEDRSF